MGLTEVRKYFLRHGEKSAIISVNDKGGFEAEWPIPACTFYDLIIWISLTS